MDPPKGPSSSCPWPALERMARKLHRHAAQCEVPFPYCFVIPVPCSDGCKGPFGPALLDCNASGLARLHAAGLGTEPSRKSRRSLALSPRAILANRPSWPFERVRNPSVAPSSSWRPISPTLGERVRKREGGKAKSGGSVISESQTNGRLQ